MDEAADILQTEFEAFMRSVYLHRPKPNAAEYHQLRNAFFAGAFAALKDSYASEAA